MSRTKKLTLSGLVTALCVICLALGSLAPNLALSLAALAGLFPAAVVITCGSGWAAGVWAAAGLLALLLLPNKTAAVWFACFFGHYPIWKALIEAFQTRQGKPWLGWLLKLLGFALCGAVLFVGFRSFFLAGLPLDVSAGESGAIAGPYVLLLPLALLAAYLAYDVAFSILIGWFRVKILPKLK